MYKEDSSLMQGTTYDHFVPEKLFGALDCNILINIIKSSNFGPDKKIQHKISKKKDISYLVAMLLLPYILHVI